MKRLIAFAFLFISASAISQGITLAAPTTVEYSLRRQTDSTEISGAIYYLYRLSVNNYSSTPICLLMDAGGKIISDMYSYPRCMKYIEKQDTSYYESDLMIPASKCHSGIDSSALTPIVLFPNASFSTKLYLKKCPPRKRAVLSIPYLEGNIDYTRIENYYWYSSGKGNMPLSNIRRYTISIL
jgi:hypothetical protein